MSSLKPLPAIAISPSTSSLPHCKPIFTLECQKQKESDVVTREVTAKDNRLNPPKDELGIIRPLNPPKMRTFQKKLQNIQGQFCGFCRKTLKLIVLTSQPERPRPLSPQSKMLLEQKWLAAFSEMPQSMQTMYRDANLTFDVSDAFGPKETDYMHKAAIAVHEAVVWATRQSWSSVKKGMTLAESLAARSGTTLPDSAYEDVINACADRVIELFKTWYFLAAREGLATAEYLAKRIGKTLPNRIYEIAMDEYINKAVMSAGRRAQQTIKFEINMAKYFAMRAGKPFPVSVYERIANV